MWICLFMVWHINFASLFTHPFWGWKGDRRYRWGIGWANVFWNAAGNDRDQGTWIHVNHFRDEPIILSKIGRSLRPVLRSFIDSVESRHFVPADRLNVFAGLNIWRVVEELELFHVNHARCCSIRKNSGKAMTLRSSWRLSSPSRICWGPYPKV
jgi:hypothetical protein